MKIYTRFGRPVNKEKDVKYLNNLYTDYLLKYNFGICELNKIYSQN